MLVINYTILSKIHLLIVLMHYLLIKFSIKFLSNLDYFNTFYKIYEASLLTICKFVVLKYSKHVSHYILFL